MSELALHPTAQDLLFRQARTANTFTAEPVTDEQMQAVYDLVKYAPTAYNQSPLRVVWSAPTRPASGSWASWTRGTGARRRPRR